MLDALFIILGAVLVLWGADRLTEGASEIARRLKITEIVVGLTVVAMGTSMPEFFVSLMSAVKGTSDLAVGNVVGSNIFNTLLIVGVTAMVAPMTISAGTVRKDIPFAVLTSMALLVFGFNGEISRLDAVLLFVGFLIFMWVTVKGAKTQPQTVPDGGEQVAQPAMKTWVACCYVVLGLACLVGGSNLFVDGATNIARTFGVSDAVIGLTIVAGGTSLPELATSVVAAKKGKSAIAIGNVIGSNVFNILMILGVTGLILPMDVQGITMVDYSVMLGSILLLWFFCYTKYTVSRWEGAALSAIFIAYIGYLIYNL
jgi:cation:H+ antiporter